jgi:Kef-type K+ transport system membrane component KefB
MPPNESIIFTIFLIFSGAALLATLALYARQALLVVYILLGVLLGPSVGDVVSDPDLIREIAHVGIIFLLFLMGLELNPRDLLLLLRKTVLVTLVSSLAFAGIGVLLALAFGFGLGESLVVGAAATFSSTIIGLKLLPTTVLHHQRTGEVVISILLLQDLLAILLLVVLKGGGAEEHPVLEVVKLVLAVPLLAGVAALAVRFVLLHLIRTFDTIREYVFLLAIGWCLGVAEAAAALGVSHEIGAFIAGVTLATSPVSLYMAENLRPLRDFFLIMFFFSLGAGFDLSMIGGVLLPAALLAGLMLAIKPPVFRLLLRLAGESAQRSGEIGVRLGQMSEFSLLVAVLALDRGEIGEQASYLIQLATLLTFMVSTYLVVLRYPTPIALSEDLRRD